MGPLSGILSVKITKKSMYMLAIEIQVLPLSVYAKLTLVHDFGYPINMFIMAKFSFLKFDPSKIRYMEVQALPLRPDLAKVGVEIRVVGCVCEIDHSNI